MKLIIVLTLVCICSAVLLGLTYDLTSKKIEAQLEKIETEAVKVVLPTADKISEKNTDLPTEYYEGYAGGKLIGYAFTGSGKGYSSTITIMIGVDTKMDIQGIKILSQQETPGLGTRVDEIVSKNTLWDVLEGKRKEDPKQPWFQAQFQGKTLDTLNDIKFITGSTITSKAVLNIVETTIKKFETELSRSGSSDFSGKSGDNSNNDSTNDNGK